MTMPPPPTAIDDGTILVYLSQYRKVLSEFSEEHSRRECLLGWLASTSKEIDYTCLLGPSTRPRSIARVNPSSVSACKPLPFGTIEPFSM